MRIIFVLAVLFIIGASASDSDMDDIFDNSDESAFEPDDSDDDFGQNSQESSSGDVDEEISQEPAPKPKPKPNPKPTPVEKPDVDNSWKKTGIEDKTLLAFAFVGNDDAEKAKLWIKRGADVNGKDEKQETALHKTAYKDNVKFAEVLIQNGADVNAVDASGRTPLRLAKSQGSGKVAELLIKNGGKETAPRKRSDDIKKPPVFTPEPPKPMTLEEMLLDVAFQAGDNAEEANDLIELEIDVNTKIDSIGQTPLHRTAYKDNMHVARALIRHGANVNVLDKGGRSPLHIAAIQGSMKVARILIENGANVNSADLMENRPLFDAIRFSNMDLAKLLIENGADVNALNIFKETPLHMIFMCDNPGILSFILRKGANIGLRDDLNRNARDYMKQYGNARINFEIDRLLEEAEAKNMQQHFG